MPWPIRAPARLRDAQRDGRPRDEVDDRRRGPAVIAERRARELETQKELGLWHPSLHRKQQQNRATATERGAKPTQPKKRLRGIGSGIGKFRGGTLHLSDKDVQRIKSQGSRK